MKELSYFGYMWIELVVFSIVMMCIILSESNFKVNLILVFGLIAILRLTFVWVVCNYKEERELITRWKQKKKD